MSETVKIPLDTANRDQLMYYARSILNIEVNDRCNSQTVRAKIQQASPSTTEIAVPANIGNAIHSAEDIAAEADSAEPGRALTTHFRDDPKVELMIQATTEGQRAKDVQLACQGDVLLVKRGARVSIPYRFYISCLCDGIETVAKDSDEINPQTGLPIKEWVDQHSYPFQIYSLPSDAEIAAWDKRVSGVQLS